MDFIISTIRTLLRHLWMILVGTALFTLFVIYYTRHMVGGYEVKATLYTGVASGYNLYNPQNEMFRLLGTKRSFSQNETFFFSHPYPPTLPFST